LLFDGWWESGKYATKRVVFDGEALHLEAGCVGAIALLAHLRHSGGSRLRLGAHKASLKLYGSFLTQDRVFLLKLVFSSQTN
jgi:hypothetical protein